MPTPAPIQVHDVKEQRKNFYRNGSALQGIDSPKRAILEAPSGMEAFGARRAA
jgi:hypothetical protein